MGDTKSFTDADLTRLADSLGSIKDNAAQVATLAQRARQSAALGLSALTDVQTTVDTFVDSTREIDSLLEQINLFSQQVHILGVNAAIEAANAGEHGTGFTIIAEEMRRIAAQVKDTSIQVQKLLERTSSMADDTVGAMETASENLEVLEVSADISESLNDDNAEIATNHLDHLRIRLGLEEG